MEFHDFERMVARLEGESARAPRAYLVRVALLAALGFAVLALVLGFAGLGLLLLAGAAVAMLMTGAKALILLAKLGKLLVLLAVPLWMLLKSSVSALFARLPAPQGLELRRADAPVLFDTLDGLRRRLGGPRFHHVLVRAEMNAGVVQRPWLGLFGGPRNHLLLGLPLLEVLSPDEALAVIAHEYGHLAGSHSRFGAFIYRLRLSWSRIQAVSTQWNGWGGRALQRLVAWYAPYFNAYTFVLARTNEYQADAASAGIVGAATVSRALMRVDVSAEAYGKFLQETFKSMRIEPAPPRDLALQWATHSRVAVPAEQSGEWLRKALDQQGQVADTHPVLRKRLAALGMAADAPEPPAPLAGPSAAEAWLGAHAAVVRERLQAEWHQDVAERWQAQHGEWQQLRQRLAELDGVEAPSADERIEALRLRLQLQPDDDHLPALVAFNADQPDHALGLFIEADWRLDAGDESGLPLLDRVMALDAQATKASCQLAHAFLRGRGDVRAETYLARWNERHRWELERQAQLDHLDVAHELRPAGLDAEALQVVVSRLRGHGGGVARAWLARRVIPADDQAMTWVLGLELTLWARLRKQGPAIVRRLAVQEWPVGLHVCTLADRHAVLKPRLRRLPDAQVWPA